LHLKWSHQYIPCNSLFLRDRPSVTYVRLALQPAHPSSIIDEFICVKAARAWPQCGQQYLWINCMYDGDEHLQWFFTQKCLVLSSEIEKNWSLYDILFTSIILKKHLWPSVKNYPLYFCISLYLLKFTSISLKSIYDYLYNIFQ